MLFQARKMPKMFETSQKFFSRWFAGKWNVETRLKRIAEIAVPPAAPL